MDVLQSDSALDCKEGTDVVISDLMTMCVTEGLRDHQNQSLSSLIIFTMQLSYLVRQNERQLHSFRMQLVKGLYNSGHLRTV